MGGMDRLTSGTDPNCECSRCTAECVNEWDGLCWVRLAIKRLAAYEDTGLSPDEIAALRAENAAFKADIEAGRMVRVPHKVGDKVYVISNCQGVRRSLDGTMYSHDGSPGTATGYYCAYDENWDECPLAKGREECDEKGCAVFEDTISAITICLDDENEGPCVYIGLSNVAEYRDNKIYGTEEAARAALDAQEGAKQ